MKRSGFKQKQTVPMKRSGFKPAKFRIFKKKEINPNAPKKKRKQKTPLQKAKDKLWELCKQLTRKVYGHHCYTCNDYVDFPHTGHFITDSICATELSYDLKNLRPQCYACNIHHSGNWPAFEARLIRDQGRSYIEELKDRNNLLKRSGLDSNGEKYDIFWYEKKIVEYQALLDKLNK